MKKVDYIIPVIVLILVSIFGVLLYNNKYKNNLELNKTNIIKELDLNVKGITKKYGKEDKLLNINTSNIVCYYYKELERCYSVDKNDKVKSIFIKGDEISFEKIKLNSSFKDVTDTFGDKKEVDNDKNCYLKYKYKEYTVNFISNDKCNKTNNVDIIEIQKN